ncbi:MAG TPA: hypothetical protein VJ890_24930 [Vineibacter sp.]|nr:hypothetical protein [Vineibacter sp.]
MRLATHSQRLERWLGADEVARISDSMRDWYGPPIAVARVPGEVLAHRGGDFRGRIDAGGEASLLERAVDGMRRLNRRIGRLAERQRRRAVFGTGFASLSDLIYEATNGKRQELAFQKVGVTGVVAATSTLWYVGNQPAAGANGAAAPGGTAMSVATTGALGFNSPAVSGDTTHFVGGLPVASVAGNTLLLYDRLFSVTKTMNSTATEAVSGVPTRYQSTSAGAHNSAEGNFLMVECRTALPATAHNWTTCLYTDQSGNTGVTLPSVAGNSSNIQYRLDQPASQWFCPLASGDTGVLALTQMQCSAAVATGAIDFTIGHPLAWLPCPVANVGLWTDGINSAFNLVRIFDSACLAFLEVTKSTTGATTYTGTVTVVSG